MSAKQGQQSGNGGTERLEKTMGLWDVYSLATGAMFSSGFFLLPAIVITTSGPSATVAYLIAGLLMVPASLAMLELSTALPRAGGAYYFIDRSLGPAIGTVAGIGTWLSLVLKSSFALVGIGAYLAVAPFIGEFISPGDTATVWFMKLSAVVLTGVFVLVNIFGAKQSTRLQGILVAVLLTVLIVFLIEGLRHVTGMPGESVADQHLPFFAPDNGLHGLLAGVGVVFVSYAGLTKVASVSEEVRRPERTLPMGVLLALTTTTVAYVLGVFVMISVLGQENLSSGYAPVAAAAGELFDWLPGRTGVVLVVVAAVFAFISTGNAGILAASRYPLAMARDQLLPERLEYLGRFGTPTLGICATGLAMVVFILTLPLQDVAKLGSTFNLLVFGMLNLAVIVMRESRIESYDPSFRVPLYPWLPVLGMLVSAILIIEMGWLAIAFSTAVILLGLLWFTWYARRRVGRSGASRYVFARWGRDRHPELRTEFWEIIKEKGLREHDPYDEIVHRAQIIEVQAQDDLTQVINAAAQKLAAHLPLSAPEVAEHLASVVHQGESIVEQGVMFVPLRLPDLEHAHLVLARAAESMRTDTETGDQHETGEIYGAIFLVSPQHEPGEHLRVLAELTERPQDEAFLHSWRRISDYSKLKEMLLRDARFLVLFVDEDEATRPLAGMQVAELDLPPGAFLAMIRRQGELLEPRDDTVLQFEDSLTLIGEVGGIDELYRRYIGPATA